MKPIGKYIIIKMIKEELKTESGLLLSAQDASEFRYKKGEVIKEGTNVTVIEPGDIIYYDELKEPTKNLNYFFDLAKCKLTYYYYKILN